MNQNYIDYLKDKARNGDKQAFHQLKRKGIIVEPEEDLKDAETNLFAYQGELEGRQMDSIKVKNTFVGLPDWMKM